MVALQIEVTQMRAADNWPCGNTAHPQCPTAACAAAAELWQDLGPQHFPLPNISRMGSVIDTGVELRQFNVAPQLAANQSITFSRDGNEPPGGALGMGQWSSGG